MQNGTRVEKIFYPDPGQKSGEKEGKELMNICLYCGSQNFPSGG
jgi:hypothetical protein